ncbi:MAG: hypothetical protein ACEY3K_12250 [Wolbachia sp.]
MLYLEKNLDTLSYDTILKNSFYQDCFTFRDTDLQKMEEELKGVFSQVSEKLEDVHVTNGVQAENKGRQMLSGA